MSPKQAYEAYLALKLHFTTTYDFHKYKGKVSVKVVNSLSQKNGMKYSVERLSKHKDPKNFLLANLLYDSDWTPIKFRDERSKQIYLNWKKRTDGLLYNFEQDLSKLVEPFDNNFVCREGRPPSLLLSYVAGIINAETVAILLEMTKTGSIWCEKLHKMDHPHSQIAFRLNKYPKFLDYDKKLYASRVMEKFSQSVKKEWTSLALSA